MPSTYIIIDSFDDRQLLGAMASLELNRMWRNHEGDNGWFHPFDWSHEEQDYPVLSATVKQYLESQSLDPRTNVAFYYWW